MVANKAPRRIAVDINQGQVQAEGKQAKPKHVSWLKRKKVKGTPVVAAPAPVEPLPIEVPKVEEPMIDVFVPEPKVTFKDKLKLFWYGPEEGGDGCTGFPDSVWAMCCKLHDEDYEVGGTWRDRLDSDVFLAGCVYDAVNDHLGGLGRAYGRTLLGRDSRHSGGSILGFLLALFMFVGVRIFASPWCLPCYIWPRWRNKARWGYGRKK
jgi:hypothetical protein